MKKLFPILFIFFSIGTLSAQNLNFKDTNGLAKFLCSGPWICYRLNPDSTFSNKIMDSIRFYSNRTFIDNESDTIIQDKPVFMKIQGDWNFGKSGKLTNAVNTKNNITIDLRAEDGSGYRILVLIYGHKIPSSYKGKYWRELKGPFIVGSSPENKILRDWQELYQPYREFKKPKNTATKAQKH